MNQAPKDCVGAFAWVLGDVRRLVQPVPYRDRPGASTWVKLDEAKAAEVHTAGRYEPVPVTRGSRL